MWDPDWVGVAVVLGIGLGFVIGVPGLFPRRKK